MKRKINSILYVSALTTMLLSSCQADFVDINRDHRQPTEKQLEQDNLNVGGFVTSFEKTIFPVGSSGTNYVNDYQIPYTLGGACWIGYMAPAQNKWVGRGFPSFALKPWSQYTFNVMAGNAFRNWLDVKKRTTTDPEGFAVAQIIKVAAVHKAADTYGPIPYSKAGQEGSTDAEYDSQEDVYKAMLKELDEAVHTLANGSHDVFSKYDIIYEGNYTKWCKFANSLMLRLAMRIVYANPTLAKQYAEKALTNPYGVIENTKEAAKLSKGAGVSLRNPLVIINGSYNDVRMGAEISSYLKGYNDPRIASYFVKAKNNGIEDYYAVRTNIPSIDDYLSKEKSSSLNVEDATPIYIIKASEVYFLRAEGALRGWNMGGGTAQSYYEKGITTSFEENDLSASQAATYIANSTNVPANFVDALHPEYDTPATSTITIKWETGASNFERNLERIITQKYLAIYPDGQEAWSEYRRTGYPHIFPAVLTATDCDVDGNLRPTRIPYSNDEYVKNLENVKKAVQLLNGADNGATRVWWDKKIK